MAVVLQDVVQDRQGLEPKRAQDPAAKASKPRAQHFGFLDALRGIAALWVVLYHLAVVSALPEVSGGIGGFIWNGLFGKGHFGVQVFFVLSGFVIAHATRTGFAKISGLGHFMVRRVVRLTPPYWAGIAFALAMHTLAVIVNGEAFAPGGEPLTLGRLAAQLVYIQDLLLFENINTVFWTLGYEMQFYLVFGFFLLVLNQLDRRFEANMLPALVVPVCVASIIPNFFTDVDLGRGGALIVFYCFFLGAVIYWHWSGRLSWWIPAAYALGIATILTVDHQRLVVIPTLATAALVVAAGRSDGLERWLSARPYKFLGKISYSLYIVHVPIVGAVALIATKLAGTGLAAFALSTVLSVALSLIVGTVFWRLTEVPSIAWGKALKRSPKAATPQPQSALAQLR